VSLDLIKPLGEMSLQEFQTLLLVIFSFLVFSVVKGGNGNTFNERSDGLGRFASKLLGGAQELGS